MSDLIYDLGLHVGEDSEFYLKKGFRVVAVDANPDICRVAADRLREYVDDGRLTIVNKAIAERRGSLTFYRNERSEWGTLDAERAARHRAFGADSEEIVVDAVPLGEIVAQHGEPYFVKIDIEGMDHVALASLAGTSFRPKYISIESDKVSFRKVEDEIALLQEMGYDRFKVVQQRDVPRQVPPNPPREGRYVDHRFPKGASGLFGEEAPGEWVDAKAALKLYRRIFWKYRLYGDNPVIGGQFVRRAVWRFRIRPGWYDTHARHSTAWQG